METTTIKTYIKNGQTVIVDTENLFVYETDVYLYHKGYFSLIKSKYYSSPVEIKNVVGSFWKNKHTQICSELFSAPEKWLIDNGYMLYQKPEKIKRQKSKN